MSIKSLSYRLTDWAVQLASNSHYHSLELDQESLVFLDADSQTHRIDFLSLVSGVLIEVGWFWNTLVFRQLNGDAVRFGDGPRQP